MRDTFGIDHVTLQLERETLKSSKAPSVTRRGSGFVLQSTCKFALLGS